MSALTISTLMVATAPTMAQLEATIDLEGTIDTDSNNLNQIIPEPDQPRHLEKQRQLPSKTQPALPTKTSTASSTKTKPAMKKNAESKLNATQQEAIKQLRIRLKHNVDNKIKAYKKTNGSDKLTAEQEEAIKNLRKRNKIIVDAKIKGLINGSLIAVQSDLGVIGKAPQVYIESSKIPLVTDEVATVYKPMNKQKANK